LRRWVGKVIVREARGRGIESCRVQKKKFSIRDIWSRFYHFGLKPLVKTGTKGSLEPGQKTQYVVVYELIRITESQAFH